MDKNEEFSEVKQPNIDESEYKMPTAQHAPVIESKNKVIKIILILFLIIFMAGIMYYLYYGMKNTPADIGPVSTETNTDSSDKDFADSQQVEEMQERLQDAPPATPADIEAMRLRLSGGSNTETVVSE
jgi:flagellar basal body-associated protein FliL